ncbi:cytochrome c oxidase accessory protein CcoG [Botrimarina hoheduenensis]|uniref:Ubp3 associated protein Bre5 n=1 Tax=Botrimarina hoheduenensis TaxID=2528000 RepID=A0A5C5VT29_9BACT|nr:cytochrome c oxidase accessory protein CcoG [Botrimarina hoheduenensis]TWT40769.1 Ubp3 associated protein Bre5 [Botrimarina hoheduenensis]
MTTTNQLPVLQPEERVLSTLDQDGRRRWLSPRLSTGRFWSRRRLVAYGLIALYTLLPFIRIGGRPAIQLDLFNGRFALFGLELRPTDLELLAVFGLLVGLSIFFLTAIFGRVWCGWGCPQTVYMEFVFRPLERFFTGVSGRGGKPRGSVPAWRSGLMYLVFLVICWHLANTFLAYFVGVEALHRWIWTQPPWAHPGAFALVLSVTVLMMFDFCYWREQMCIIGCPYGRFQSVLLDPSSLIVGYDKRRGEPRGRGRDRQEKGLGDCVNCHMCVDVCPTGIDIRDGLQLECINCTQCIDVCDSVMDRVGTPRGLIRYSSQRALAGEPTRIVRARVLIYAGVILGLLILFLTLLTNRRPFDVTLLRGLGRPFSTAPGGEIENLLRAKIVNRGTAANRYQIEVLSPATVHLAEVRTLEIEAGDSLTEPIRLLAPSTAFAERGGTLEIALRFRDQTEGQVELNYWLFGPAKVPSPAPSSNLLSNP